MATAAKHLSIDSSESDETLASAKQALHLCATSMLLVLAIMAAVVFKARFADLPHSNSYSTQRNYSQFANEQQPTFWLEFGKGGSDRHLRISNDSYSVSLSNFSTGTKTKQPVYWSTRCEKNCTISVSFTQAKPKAIALYLTDSDSHERASTIHAAGITRVASKLDHGKWVQLPVTSEQLSNKQIELKLETLAGSDIALSALAVVE